LHRPANTAATGRRVARVTAALLFACQLASPSQAPPANAAGPHGALTAFAPPQLRVAQVLLFQGTTPAEIEANLARLKSAGVTTVFVRVFQNHGDRPLFFGGRPTPAVGVYFPTAAAPVVADDLAVVSAACRRLGLSIYAWMTTRACDWLLAERPDLAELRYDSAVGQVLPAGRLNIFHPVVRRRLTAVFRDLARADIDGVLFQDDLVLKAGEGFSPEAVAAYLKESGTAVTPGELFECAAGAGAGAIFSPAFYREAFWPWAAWKNRALLDLAQELMAAAREVRPGLRFALNMYYETVLNPRMALAWYAQDLGVARSRPFDYFSLMSYHRQIGRELSYAPDDAIAAVGVLSRQAAAIAGDPARVIVKVQSLDWETRAMIPAPEFDRVLGAASPGVSLAFVRGLEDPDLDVVRRHFSR
jgi:poly-beta-1,6-N-acetyl-D-glucosamine N-deacetylase